MDFAGHSTVRVGDFEERAGDARTGIGETREDGISRDDGRSRELTGARFPDTVCVWPAVAHCMRSDTSHFKRETISFVVVAVAVPVWRCHRRTRYRCRVQHTCACGVSGHTHTHTLVRNIREKIPRNTGRWEVALSHAVPADMAFQLSRVYRMLRMITRPKVLYTRAFCYNNNNTSNTI